MGCINKEDLKKYGERAQGFADEDRFGDEIKRHAKKCSSCRKQVAYFRRQEERIKILQATVKCNKGL